MFGSYHLEWLRGFCAGSRTRAGDMEAAAGDAMTAHAITNFRWGVGGVARGMQFW